MHQIHIPSDASAEVHARFCTIAADADNLESLLPDLVQCAAMLPRETVRDLLAFRSAPDAPGAFLIRGLPVDTDLPPTPQESRPPPYKRGRVSECSMLMIAILLGEPVAYRAEKNGALVQDVFPTRAEQSSPSNESSAVALGFHTELTFSRSAPERPYHLASPDFVLLLCLRCPQERRAATQFIEARDLCRQLDADAIAELRRETFQLQAPYSFTRDDGDDRPWSVPVPLVRGSTAAPVFAFDTACGVRALTPEAELALDALRAACNDTALHGRVELQPGDLLVINNLRCAHARSPFQAAFDGRDRWLQRAYVRRSIWELPAENATSYRVLI
jgi:L-asparagine oxygenase